MSKAQFLRCLIYLLIVSAAISCSKLRRLQKSDDWEKKYQGAMNYYEEKDYYRASILFEEVLPIIRGTKQAELAQFYNAYSYYYQKQYILSAHYFENFSKIYGRSKHAMEATFMHAYSLYLQSPEYNLDQTPTYKAITAMQNFINKYPYSEFKERSTEIIDILQTKLELKGYENAKQYEKLRLYEAAIIAFENFSEDFPDSDYNEELKFRKIRTQFEFARNSTKRRQEERYQAVIDEYYEFIDEYAESKYLTEAEDLFGKAVDRLEKVKEIANLN
ncbi:MAG: outer membrane protein assembly factor BamD [Cyclobacteriaceae bacterium]